MIIEHTTHTSGWWLWRQSNPSVKVRIANHDFPRFDEILQRETVNPDGGCVQPKTDEYEVGFKTVRERNEYPIGAEVELLFSTAGCADQFFTGARPFRWDGMKKLETPSPMSPTLSCMMCGHNETRLTALFCAKCGHNFCGAVNLES